MDCRVYKECVQGLTWGAQRMAGKTQGATGNIGIFIRTGVFRANSEGSILLRYNFPLLIQIHCRGWWRYLYALI